MPLTFSHPALALPLYYLRRSYFSVTGLALGSMAPDFEYFIRMKKGPSVYSHTFSALFWFNLPLTLGLAFLFHGIIKKPLLHNLPPWLFMKFGESEYFNWYAYFKRKWLVVIYSILLGAASHLLWDWFTHYSINFTNGNHRLEFTINGRYFQIHTYTIIHVLYSLAGLVYLFVLLVQMPAQNTRALPNRDIWYWPKILLVSIFIFWLRMALGPSLNTDDMAVTTISAVMLAITIISFLSKK